jgi:hypothetical protein
MRLLIMLSGMCSGKVGESVAMRMKEIYKIVVLMKGSYFLSKGNSIYEETEIIGLVVCKLSSRL